MHETDSNVTRTSIRSLKMQKGNDSMLNATEIEGHHKVGDEDENEDNDGEEGKEEDDSPLIQRLNRMEHLLERVASSEEKTSQRKRGSTGGGELSSWSRCVCRAFLDNLMLMKLLLWWL